MTAASQTCLNQPKLKGPKRTLCPFHLYKEVTSLYSFGGDRCRENTHNTGNSQLSGSCPCCLLITVMFPPFFFLAKLRPAAVQCWCIDCTSAMASTSQCGSGNRHCMALFSCCCAMGSFCCSTVSGWALGFRRGAWTGWGTGGCRDLGF